MAMLGALPQPDHARSLPALMAMLGAHHHLTMLGVPHDNARSPLPQPDHARSLCYK